MDYLQKGKSKKNNYFFSPSFEKGLVKFEQSVRNKDRVNQLRKLCFSTSISALLDEYLQLESQNESREITSAGKIVEPIIVSDMKFVRELERAKKFQRDGSGRKKSITKSPGRKSVRKQSWFPAKSPQRLPDNSAKKQNIQNKRKDSTGSKCRVTPFDLNNKQKILNQDLQETNFNKKQLIPFQLRDEEIPDDEFSGLEESPSRKAVPKFEQMKAPTNIQTPSQVKTQYKKLQSAQSVQNFPPFVGKEELMSFIVQRNDLPNPILLSHTNTLSAVSLKKQKKEQQYNSETYKKRNKKLYRKTSDERILTTDYSSQNLTGPSKIKSPRTKEYLHTQAMRVKESLIKKKVKDSKLMYSDDYQTPEKEPIFFQKEQIGLSTFSIYNPHMTLRKHLSSNSNQPSAPNFRTPVKAPSDKYNKLNFRTKSFEKIGQIVSVEESRKKVTSIKTMLKGSPSLQKAKSKIVNLNQI